MVIIIGATGFIGHYTTKYFLEQGVEVLACGRNEKKGEKLKKMGAKFITFDLTKPEDINKLPTKMLMELYF